MANVNPNSTGMPGTTGGGSEMNNQTTPAAKSSNSGHVLKRRGSGSGKQAKFS